MATEVLIHPFGKIAGYLLNAVQTAIEEHFDLRAAIGKELAVPAQSYSRERGQYLSTSFLDLLVEHARDRDRILLGITAVDLYVPELNFVFGEASSTDHVAVFSLARLYSTTNAGREREEIVKRRAITEAVHEVGHVLSLRHCSRRDCVMWFSNTLAETDRKGTDFCPKHSQELKRALRSSAMIAVKRK
jgi:archaemetzincin